MTETVHVSGSLFEARRNWDGGRTSAPSEVGGARTEETARICARTTKRARQPHRFDEDVAQAMGVLHRLHVLKHRETLYTML